MSVSTNIRTPTASRKRIKYTEQPFPHSENTAEVQVNQQVESRLFKVPRELRNKFYEMVYRNTTLPVDVAAMFYCDGADSRHSAALILTW